MAHPKEYAWGCLQLEGDDSLQTARRKQQLLLLLIKAQEQRIQRARHACDQGPDVPCSHQALDPISSHSLQATRGPALSLHNTAAVPVIGRSAGGKETARHVLVSGTGLQEAVGARAAAACTSDNPCAQEAAACQVSQQAQQQQQQQGVPEQQQQQQQVVQQQQHQTSQQLLQQHCDTQHHTEQHHNEQQSICVDEDVHVVPATPCHQMPTDSESPTRAHVTLVGPSITPEGHTLAPDKVCAVAGASACVSPLQHSAVQGDMGLAVQGVARHVSARVQGTAVQSNMRIATAAAAAAAAGGAADNRSPIKQHAASHDHDLQLTPSPAVAVARRHHATAIRSTSPNRKLPPTCPAPLRFATTHTAADGVPEVCRVVRVASTPPEDLRSRVISDPKHMPAQQAGLQAAQAQQPATLGHTEVHSPATRTHTCTAQPVVPGPAQEMSYEVQGASIPLVLFPLGSGQEAPCGAHQAGTGASEHRLQGYNQQHEDSLQHDDDMQQGGGAQQQSGDQEAGERRPCGQAAIVTAQETTQQQQQQQQTCTGHEAQQAQPNIQHDSEVGQVPWRRRRRRKGEGRDGHKQVHGNVETAERCESHGDVGQVASATCKPAAAAAAATASTNIRSAAATTTTTGNNATADAATAATTVPATSTAAAAAAAASSMPGPKTMAQPGICTVIGQAGRMDVHVAEAAQFSNHELQAVRVRSEQHAGHATDKQLQKGCMQTIECGTCLTQGQLVVGMVDESTAPTHSLADGNTMVDSPAHIQPQYAINTAAAIDTIVIPPTRLAPSATAAEANGHLGLGIETTARETAVGKGGQMPLVGVHGVALTGAVVHVASSMCGSLLSVIMQGNTASSSRTQEHGRQGVMNASRHGHSSPGSLELVVFQVAADLTLNRSDPALPATTITTATTTTAVGCHTVDAADDHGHHSVSAGSALSLLTPAPLQVTLSQQFSGHGLCSPAAIILPRVVTGISHLLEGSEAFEHVVPGSCSRALHSRFSGSERSAWQSGPQTPPVPHNTPAQARGLLEPPLVLVLSGAVHSPGFGAASTQSQIRLLMWQPKAAAAEDARPALAESVAISDKRASRYAGAWQFLQVLEAQAVMLSVLCCSDGSSVMAAGQNGQAAIWNLRFMRNQVSESALAQIGGTLGSPHPVHASMHMGSSLPMRASQAEDGACSELVCDVFEYFRLPQAKQHGTPLKDIVSLTSLPQQPHMVMGCEDATQGNSGVALWDTTRRQCVLTAMLHEPSPNREGTMFTMPVPLEILTALQQAKETTAVADVDVMCNITTNAVQTGASDMIEQQGVVGKVGIMAGITEGAAGAQLSAMDVEMQQLQDQQCQHQRRCQEQQQQQQQQQGQQQQQDHMQGQQQQGPQQQQEGRTQVDMMVMGPPGVASHLVSKAQTSSPTLAHHSSGHTPLPTKHAATSSQHASGVVRTPAATMFGQSPVTGTWARQGTAARHVGPANPMSGTLLPAGLQAGGHVHTTTTRLGRASNGVANAIRGTAGVGTMLAGGFGGVPSCTTCTPACRTPNTTPVTGAAVSTRLMSGGFSTGGYTGGYTGGWAGGWTPRSTGGHAMSALRDGVAIQWEHELLTLENPLILLSAMSMPFSPSISNAATATGAGTRSPPAAGAAAGPVAHAPLLPAAVGSAGFGATTSNSIPQAEQQLASSQQHNAAAAAARQPGLVQQQHEDAVVVASTLHPSNDTRKRVPPRSTCARLSVLSTALAAMQPRAGGTCTVTAPFSDTPIGHMLSSDVGASAACGHQVLLVTHSGQITLWDVLLGQAVWSVQLSTFGGKQQHGQQPEGHAKSVTAMFLSPAHACVVVQESILLCSW